MQSSHGSQTHSEPRVPGIRSNVRRVFFQTWNEKATLASCFHVLCLLVLVADTPPRIRCAPVFMVSCPADLRQI